MLKTNPKSNIIQILKCEIIMKIKELTTHLSLITGGIGLSSFEWEWE